MKKLLLEWLFRKELQALREEAQKQDVLLVRKTIGMGDTVLRLNEEIRYLDRTAKEWQDLAESRLRRNQQLAMHLDNCCKDNEKLRDKLSRIKEIL